MASKRIGRPKPKPRPRKATSDRVSRIAARVLAEYREGGNPFGSKAVDFAQFMVTNAELKALCASCLSQDETPGRREGRVRR
jgi:hypothetical protein